MHFGKKYWGFTILEILLASAFTVAITTSAILCIRTILDYKKTENARSKLAFEAFQVLNEIENTLASKCASLGNLLMGEQSYPFQVQIDENGCSSLSFFMVSPEGPRAIRYCLALLPPTISHPTTHATVLFLQILNADTSKTIFEKFSSDDNLGDKFPENSIVKLANLVSDSVFLFEIRLIKLAPNGSTLEYLNTEIKPIKSYAGEWTLGSDHPQNIAFLEITLGFLPKFCQDDYRRMTSSGEKKDFLNKNGIKLSRIVPWYI